MDIPLDLKLFMNNPGGGGGGGSSGGGGTTTTTTKIYKCEDCDSSYSDKTYYDLHRQTHAHAHHAHKEAIEMDAAGTVQIVLPSDDHQLTALKRAYGGAGGAGEVHQIYEITPSTRYQVVSTTPPTPQIITGVSLGSLGGSLSAAVPIYTTPYIEQPQNGGSCGSSKVNIVEGTIMTTTPATTAATATTPATTAQRLVIALDPKERPYKCDQCTASFIEQGEYNKHRKKHSNDGPFTCEDCHFTFMYKSHFRSHKTRCVKKRAAMTHPPPKPILNHTPVKRQFPTHHTAAAAAQTHHPKKHAKTHAANAQQQQQQQTQQQPQQQQQQQPQRRISQKQPTVQSFNPNNPTFKRQKKDVRQDRPFECTECDASFQTANDLQTHRSKHTGEGPFKCEECRFVFLYRKLYDAHRRRCEKKRKEQGLPTTTATTTATTTTTAPQRNVTTTITPQPQQPQQQQQQQQQQPQQIHLSQLTGPIQIHTTQIPGHGQAALIDMRHLQTLNHSATTPNQGIIEQVIHVTPVTTTLPNGRQEIKYDIIPTTTSSGHQLEVADVTQIMNLIKVKGAPQ